MRRLRNASAWVFLGVVTCVACKGKACGGKTTTSTTSPAPRLEDGGVLVVAEDPAPGPDAAAAPDPASIFQVVATGGAERWTLSRGTDGRVILGAEGVVGVVLGRDLAWDAFSSRGLPLRNYIAATLTNRFHWLGGNWPQSGWAAVTENAHRSYDSSDIVRRNGREWRTAAAGAVYLGVRPWRDKTWLALRTESHAL
jgi:hypothetical protein